MKVNRKSLKNSNRYYSYCFPHFFFLTSAVIYSRQREQILETVKSMDVHPSADDIYNRVRRRLPHISLGTVYRNLNQLVETGELSCVQDGKTVRYDWETGQHQHFRCEVCGALQNVEVSNKVIVNLLTKESGMIINEIDLEIKGICGTCAKERN